MIYLSISKINQKVIIQKIHPLGIIPKTLNKLRIIYSFTGISSLKENGQYEASNFFLQSCKEVEYCERQMALKTQVPIKGPFPTGDLFNTFLHTQSSDISFHLQRNECMGSLQGYIQQYIIKSLHNYLRYGGHRIYSCFPLQSERSVNCMYGEP